VTSEDVPAPDSALTRTPVVFFAAQTESNPKILFWQSCACTETDSIF